MQLKLLFFCTLTIITAQISVGQSKKSSSYQYTVDLTKVVDDKVYVELLTPPVTSDEITFYLPKIVPGTYAIEDYGRFIHDLTATDKKGNKLSVEKIDDNSWKIKGAKKIHKISYWVEDSYDTELKGPEIFQPAGTNIEENKNFILNNSGFVGYFSGMKTIPFKLNVIRQKDFYGSTGMIAQKTGEPLSVLHLEKSAASDDKRVDTYETENFDRLIDSPIMYSKPDTAVIKVGTTEVLIGSYSPTGKVTAKEIANSVREVLMAQKEYLGGKLPVEKYAFIFYFTDKPVVSYGALEHSYSSFYYMPEMTIDQMNQQLRDFAAHEFFHIVTPLTIHSEEIHNFDFNDPKMSKHLWLYEGMTEYFAGNVQVKYGLITPEQYLNVLRQKMSTADQFIDSVAFTDISKFTLDKYHDQYYNVYQKGALIGMCIDIQLRKLSGGKYGVQNLVADLGKKFGKNKAFQDDQLFDEITKLTYPQIGEFLKRYVGGNEKLPYAEILDLVGVTYIPEEKYQDFTLGLGNADITVAQIDNKPRLQIATTANLNAMGKAIGFQEGDVIEKMNGEKLPDLGPEFGLFIQKQIASLQEAKTFTYTVLRKDASGEMKEKELTAPVIKVDLSRRHVIKFNEAATADQLAVRNAWIKP